MAIREADVILFMIDARAGVTPLDERFAQVLRKCRQGRAPDRQQGREPRRRAGADGSLSARLRRAGGAVAPSMGSGSPTSTPSSREAVDAQPKAAEPSCRRSETARGRRRPARGRRLDRGRPAAALEPQALSQRRHRRPAQRRQVDADQPHGRRGAPADRARGRHHPRLDHGAVGVGGPRHQPRRHRRHPHASRASRASSKSSRSAMPCARSSTPKSSCCCSMRRSRSKSRIWRSPIWSSARAARMVIAVNKWDLIEDKDNGAGP